MMINEKTHMPKGRPPISEGSDKQSDILDNALTLFATQGIAGTTIAQIAKASNVTPAVIHYYFNNREGLLDSFVSQRLVPIVELIWSGITEDSLETPEQIIIELVERLFNAVEKMPQLPLLWSREVLNAGGLLRERLASIIPQNKITTVQKSFFIAQQKGLINNNIAPNLIITSIMAVVMLPLAAQTFINKMPAMLIYDKEMLRQHAIALLLNGVLSRS